MAAARIQPYVRVVPMIYAYSSPGVDYLDGWTKIGYTERQTVEQRIKQQTHTAGILPRLEWQDNAMYKDGSGDTFTDHDFHAYLESQTGTERKPGTEWFHVDGPASQRHFLTFAQRRLPGSEARLTYTLRREQEEAVARTRAYFEQGGEEFLWNAKPRFGKTLTAYDLIGRMGLSKVLIVTNRPSIANSWAEDFFKFVGWRGKYAFVSDTDALKGTPGVLSREDYISARDDEPKGMIAFESLQGLKGSVYFGGEFDKLKWMSELAFDLLIVDESQEGVDTVKTDRAFRNIQRKHTLYLSGTPFKQLAGDQFSQEQIFNWTYADEQEAKDRWSGENANPYENLPRLAMFTYQLSPMIREQIERGIDLSDGDTVDYAFDLNEFFATDERGRFVREEEVRKFLRALTTQEKYPFSTPELRRELSHTLWHLNYVAGAKAMAKLLREDEVFRDYEIVVAAGDGRTAEDDEAQKLDALHRVRNAIAQNDKTITLTVGQLTVGVTVPEWSGVLMLCNMKSPSSYMQAAFRAQNPCLMTVDGQRYRKETAYVFDFDPARTLVVFDQFANNLSTGTVNGRGTGEERKENIKRLLNFFPVLGEDEEGKMVELDAAAVLSIPRKLKSQEVVRRGFMSNFLFQNINNIFGAPAIVREILEQLPKAREENKKTDPHRLDGMDTVTVDEEGRVVVPNETVIGRTRDLFGPKIYEVTPDLTAQVEAITQTPTAEHLGALAETLKAHVKERLIAPAVEDSGMRKSAQNQMERQLDQEIDRTFLRLQGDYEQRSRVAQAELEERRLAAQTPEQVKEAEIDYATAMESALESLDHAVRETVQRTVEDKPQEVVRQIQQYQEEQVKRTVEDEVRDHLRGFARTIPSFIMAYGDDALTLSNFDAYTEDDVFLEVTGITEDNFRFLRDGGEYTDPDTGESKHFAGHLFDEVVFNDSIQEFLKKRRELANYFDESHEEDIFDYIPPQKTNQIFTPRWVVSMMVDQLEQNNPGCFDDPQKTFADLYMKSGLYITEIVKRLFRSEGLKAAFPDEKERIRHILERQVYGMAPTRIIYLIATNYILGFDEELKHTNHNFVQADTMQAAKDGKLQQIVDKHFEQGEG